MYPKLMEMHCIMTLHPLGVDRPAISLMDEDRNSAVLP
jgi:hypothetical protein